MKGQHLGEFEEIVLLAVRGLGEDATGSAVQERLRRAAGRKATLGAIYAALDRAERKALVESWLGVPEPRPGGRARRHYRVTKEGERALERSRLVRESLWRAVKEATS